MLTTFFGRHSTDYRVQIEGCAAVENLCWDADHKAPAGEAGGGEERGSEAVKSDHQSLGTGRQIQMFFNTHEIRHWAKDTKHGTSGTRHWK